MRSAHITVSIRSLSKLIWPDNVRLSEHLLIYHYFISNESCSPTLSPLISIIFLDCINYEIPQYKNTRWGIRNVCSGNGHYFKDIFKFTFEVLKKYNAGYLFLLLLNCFWEMKYIFTATLFRNGLVYLPQRKYLDMTTVCQVSIVTNHL